jgi:hypothetical protein
VSRKPKATFKVGEVVFDRYQGYNGYAIVIQITCYPCVRLRGTPGTWLSPVGWVRRLTEREKGD